MKQLSKPAMQWLIGGYALLSSCDMKCKGTNTTISIGSCGGTCVCSEDAQSCSCTEGKKMTAFSSCDVE